MQQALYNRLPQNLILPLFRNDYSHLPKSLLQQLKDIWLAAATKWDSASVSGKQNINSDFSSVL